MRIGLGYDNHRLVPGRPLVLGGVVIPAPVGEDAHSDGDVLIHALVDALLGAIGAGTSAPTSPTPTRAGRARPAASSWSGPPSWSGSGGCASPNIDAVVVLEEVRIGERKAEISRSLRGILAPFQDLPEDRVSVKAKTNERCDAVGQGRAIAAQVAVLLEEAEAPGREEGSGGGA